MQSQEPRRKKNVNLPSKSKVEKIDLEMIFLDNAQMKIIFKVSDSTLSRWRSAGILFYKKIGAKYYYPYDLVINFMRHGANK